MTLEEFADQLGIDLETARDWLRRGRIVESRPGIWRLAVTRDEADRQPRPGTRPFAGDWIDQGGTTKRRDS